VAKVVPELLLADLGISVAARKALRSATAWWLTEAQAASDRRQIRKHGYRELLPDMGLASTPQQASTIFFLYTAAFLRRKPIPVCRESKLPHWQQLRRRGSSFSGRVPQLRNNKHATGASLYLVLDFKLLRQLHADYNT